MVNFAEFDLPQEFEPPVRQQSLEQGVNEMRWDSGKLVPFRFAWVARPVTREKQRAYGFEAHDDVPVILFYNSKKTIVPIRMRRKMRYEEKVRPDGSTYQKGYAVTKEDIGKDAGPEALWELPHGYTDEIYQMQWDRFVKSQREAGTPLDKWGLATPGQINTLATVGVFSVESLADKAEEWIAEKFPGPKGSQFINLHEQAVLFKAAKTGLVDAKAQGDKILALEAELEATRAEADELRAMQAKIKGEAAPSEEKPKASEGKAASKKE